VSVLAEGAFPVTKGTYGTNQCHIGVGLDLRTNRVVVVSVIDNLIKGAAGQAIQNLNLMCGLDESAGLLLPGVWP
jgi:N-acetyl-gamma-glutamyl-phosphate reductase